MKARAYFFILIVALTPYSFSQGWEDITPRGLQRISRFQAFDSPSNNFVVFVWDTATNSRYGYRLLRQTVVDSFVTGLTFACDEPYIQYSSTRRIASIEKQNLNTDSLLLLLDDSGCPVGLIPAIHICRVPTMRVGCSQPRWVATAYRCAGRRSRMYLSNSEPGILYVVAADSILRSADGGLTFQGLRRTRSMFNPCCIDQFFVQAPGVYFAGGLNASGQSYILYRSSDAGQSWFQVFDHQVWSIVSDPLDPTLLYLASDSGIYQSTTAGLQWHTVQAGSFRVLKFARQGSNQVFAGDSHGDLWSSTDRGNSWFLFNNTITDSSVVGIYHFPDGDTLLICATNGLFKVHRSFVVGVDERGTLPQIIEIAQNYPNPFNPSTTIEVQLPQQSDFTLTIYDVLGSEVKSFKHMHAAAGTHQVVWDGTNEKGNAVSSGVYFYSLRTNNITLTKQMILMR